MSGLIRRAELFNELAPVQTLGEAYAVIQGLPEVDAVEVVYCGECKYMMPDGHCTMFADDRIRPSSADFCSAGERKDGDEHGQT